MKLTKEQTDALVDRFLSWPLPESVCSDLAVTFPGMPHRTGTNLLTATEARQMLEHVLAGVAPRVGEDEVIAGDVIAEHSGARPVREWHTGGAWLKPGESLVLQVRALKSERD